MPSLLRLERRPEAGWILAEGPMVVGEVLPHRMTFVGFLDASAATVAASIAARVLHHWHAARRASDPAPTVSLTADGTGFTFRLATPLWSAVLLELAQQVHTATLSLRYSQPEPAA